MSPNEFNPGPVAAKNNKFNLALDLRYVVLLMLLVIVGMLFVWKPWAQSSVVKDDRTISVSGEAKIKAEPDEYVFYPTYEFKGAVNDVVLADLTKKSDEVVKQLKELGVEESKIKTNSDGYSQPEILPDRAKPSDITYSLRLTVTVEKREDAQKVQDYLVTTAPSGQVSPQPNFSDAKRKELESRARDEATKDARAKADQSAKNLGFKVDKIKSIEDGARDGINPFLKSSDVAHGADALKSSSLGVQPGEQELSYSVIAVYYIR